MIADKQELVVALLGMSSEDVVLQFKTCYKFTLVVRSSKLGLSLLSCSSIFRLCKVISTVKLGRSNRKDTLPQKQ